MNKLFYKKYPECLCSRCGRHRIDFKEELCLCGYCPHFAYCEPPLYWCPRLDFEKFSANCSHRILDQRGIGYCAFSDGTVGSCAWVFCPQKRR